MNTAELWEQIRGKRVVVGPAEKLGDGKTRLGAPYVEHTAEYTRFTSDVRDYTWPETDDLLEELYEYGVLTVTVDLHVHSGETHDRDYVVFHEPEHNSEDLLRFILSLYKTTEWTWNTYDEWEQVINAN